MKHSTLQVLSSGTGLKQSCMDQKVLAKIKKKLEEEKINLEQELAEFATKDRRVASNYQSRFPQYGNDEGENANEVAAYGDLLSLEHTLEQQLRDVTKALGSIEAGTYGTCKHCGKQIEEQRLLIRPVSTSCVACKKRLKGEA